MNQQFTGLKIKNCSKHDVEFLFCQLEKLKEFCKKNTHGSIFQAVDMEKFKTFVFKHPEFNEQQKIADFLFNINEQKNLIKNQIDLILILKQFYLRGLFF
jgi:restriction endonuclease S subunit